MRPPCPASILLLAVGWILAGCGGLETDAPVTPVEVETPSPIVSPTISQTIAARPSNTSPTATLRPGYYRNPVLDRDFPDPDILLVEEDGAAVYYAYATNANGVHVQAARSNDLVQWEYLGEVLPRLPDWAVPDFGWTWAPEVTRSPNDDGYILYFTTRFAIEKGAVQCIGTAVSSSPEGPFEPVGDRPLVCQQAQGGSIDAAFFRDEDQTAYLLWKNDGNSQGGISWIHIQQLREDGLQLVGEPVQLIKADQVWEGLLVEGPTLWKRAGVYYLFYSANDYTSPRYAVGYAVSRSALGPYEKAGSEPFLASILPAGIVGPGGQDIVAGPGGEDWLLFHGWSPGAYRSLNLAHLDWDGNEPRLGPLSREPMPGPQTLNE